MNAQTLIITVLSKLSIQGGTWLIIITVRNLLSVLSRDWGSQFHFSKTNRAQDKHIEYIILPKR